MITVTNPFGEGKQNSIDVVDDNLLFFVKSFDNEMDKELLKNRWGSITKKDTMNLNRNLIKAPEDIINYIIIHELCHLKIQGHSHNFWSFLKQFLPNYQKKIEWLNRNSQSLIS